jgi:hypothetical protein
MVGRILDKSTTITMCPTINSHHRQPVRGPCSTAWREQRTLRWRGCVVGVPALGASRVSCPLCAMHLHLGKLLAAPFDADRRQGRVVAALPLGACARHARCAQCAYVWASCLRRHSTQIVGEAVSWLLLPWPTHVVPHCARCACVWATCSQRRSTQIANSCRGCSRPGSPSASCPLCDAPAFGQPARSAVRRRSPSCVAAAPALGARACRACCARCACVWATCSQRHSTQIANSCRGCSRPGSPSASCPLCAMRLRLGNLLAAPFDADRRSRVVAAPALGGRARRASCARCACVWGARSRSCSAWGHALSTQIVGEVMPWLFPPWKLRARVVLAMRNAVAFGRGYGLSIRLQDGDREELRVPEWWFQGRRQFGALR